MVLSSAWPSSILACASSVSVAALARISESMKFSINDLITQCLPFLPLPDRIEPAWRVGLPIPGAEQVAPQIQTLNFRKFTVQDPAHGFPQCRRPFDDQLLTGGFCCLRWCDVNPIFAQVLEADPQDIDLPQRGQQFNVQVIGNHRLREVPEGQQLVIRHIPVPFRIRPQANAFAGIGADHAPLDGHRHHC